MTLAVTCPQCKRKYRVDDALVGRSATCKACGKAMQIPVGNPPSPKGLASFLDEVLAEGVQASPLNVATAAAQETPAKERQCPQCGEAVEGEGRLCGACGLPLTKKKARQYLADEPPQRERPSLALSISFLLGAFSVSLVFPITAHLFGQQGAIIVSALFLWATAALGSVNWAYYLLGEGIPDLREGLVIVLFLPCLVLGLPPAAFHLSFFVIPCWLAVIESVRYLVTEGIGLVKGTLASLICSVISLLMMVVGMQILMVAVRMSEPNRAAPERQQTASQPQQAQAIPELIAALGHQDLAERTRAARSLASIGSAVLPAVTGALASENAVVRASAARTMQFLGKEAKPAAPALMEALADKDPDVRWNSVEALLAAAPDTQGTLPAIQAAIEAEPHNYRPTLFEGLFKAKAAGAERVVVFGRALEIYVGSADDTRRMLRLLVDFGDDARLAMPSLERIVKDPAKQHLHEEVVRIMAMPSISAVPSLVQALGANHAKARERALTALTAALGRPSLTKENVPLLLEAFAVADEAAAKRLVAGLAGVDRESVPSLQEALRHENPRVRLGAVQTLARAGSDAVPALVEALGAAQDSVLRAQAQAALQSMPVSTLPALEQAIPGRPVEVRLAVVAVMREKGLAAVRPLLRIMAGEDEASAAALEALSKICAGQLRTANCGALLEAQADSDPAVRLQALRAYTKLNPGAAAMPALEKAMQDSDDTIRREAFNQVVELASQNGRALSLLENARADKNMEIRRIAVSKSKRIEDLKKRKIRSR